MTILKILQYPDPRLRRVGTKVDNVHDPRIRQIINDMLETLRITPGCAALAATQLDIENPPSITVINPVDNFSSEPLCLINPQIIEKSGVAREEEGCMSIHPQHISALVTRAARVTVRAQEPSGEEVELDAEKFFAKCLQHEIDHLEGIIYLDRLSKLKLLMVKNKISKINE